MRVVSWVVEQAGHPMVRQERDEAPGPGEVLVKTAGCGVCHTDLGFFYDGVPTRHPFPLTLGHEISGHVVAAGKGAEDWMGAAVVVPAVIPCGECAACRAGRGQICPKQVFPGNDVHGGFGSHVRVPARGLCPVPNLQSAHDNPNGIDLAALSVIADAVSTPYQAIHRARTASRRPRGLGSARAASAGSACRSPPPSARSSSRSMSTTSAWPIWRRTASHSASTPRRPTPRRCARRFVTLRSTRHSDPGASRSSRPPVIRPASRSPSACWALAACCPSWATPRSPWRSGCRT